MTLRNVLYFALFLIGLLAMCVAPVVAFRHLGPLVGSMSAAGAVLLAVGMVVIGMPVTNLLYWLTVAVCWAVTVGLGDGPAVPWAVGWLAVGIFGIVARMGLYQSVIRQRSANSQENQR